MTVAVVTIVSAFALIGVNSTRASIRRTNAARECASYLEKARVDAVRRHGEASVAFLTANATQYSVTMDFDGNGTTETRVIQYRKV
jgi:Tfp pilus assembly protein FimT